MTQVIPADNKLQPLRKAQEAIALVPQVGRITLLTRRFFNALLHLAQEDGPKSTYRRRLPDVLGRAAFESNNTEVAKEQIRRMVGIQVEWNAIGPDERRWGVSTLLADCEIIERGTEGVWIEWSYSEKVRTKLLDPEVYARISLQAYSHLRSSASAALYEICVRYQTNPSGLTMRAPWQWWRPRLTGNPEDMAGEIEYKTFKRDTLKPAIAEVNGLADIAVELIEHKDGRKVGDIQFKVGKVSQSTLNLPDPNLIDSELIQQMIDVIGIEREVAAKIYSDHDESLLKLTIELTLQRERDTNLPPLRSRAAYFKEAIRGRYAKSAVKKPVVALLPAVPVPQLLATPTPDPAILAKQADAMAAFDALAPDDQDAHWQAFLTANPGADKAYAGKKRSGPLARKALGVWLAKNQL
jgi:hypothetical protein